MSGVIDYTASGVTGGVIRASGVIGWGVIRASGVMGGVMGYVMGGVTANHTYQTPLQRLDVPHRSAERGGAIWVGWYNFLQLTRYFFQAPAEFAPPSLHPSALSAWQMCTTMPAAWQ